MDADQFAAFMHQHAVVEEQARNERTQQGQRAVHREEIKRLIKRVRVADGSTPHLVRDWIEDIQMCGPYINNHDASFRTIVEETIQGPLRKAYERFMNGQANRQAVTWAAIHAHVRAAFLTTDEDEYLRSLLEKVHQTSYETNVAYGRRFQETADRAYPLVNRAQAEERIILTAYIKGLKSKDIVKRLVQETRPPTLAAALAAIEEFTADEERFKRYGWLPEGRGEEPMEVGSVSDNTELCGTLGKLGKQLTGMQSSFGNLTDRVAKMKPKPPTSELAAVGGDRLSQTVNKLEKTVDCMQKTFTKLTGVMQQMQAKQPSQEPFRRRPASVLRTSTTMKGTTEKKIAPGKDPHTGTVTCFYCKKVGHYKKDCLKLKAKEAEAMECSEVNHLN